MKNRFYIFVVAFLASIVLVTTACDMNGLLENAESVSNHEGIENSTTEKMTEEIKESSISINGAVEETIEVNGEYVDKGVNCPDAYTVITQGKVNTTQLGTYKLTYLVYSDAGEEVKTLHRYVIVVDATPPSYVEQEDFPAFYAGFSYTIKDFLAEYSDNYYDHVSVEPNSVCFTTPGSHDVEFTLSDPAGNTTLYKKTVQVDFDMLALLNEVYKDAPHKISTNDTSMGYTHTNVRIDNDTSLGYFDSGSIHFLQEVNTSLAEYGSVQISADYGEFTTASVSFHVNNTLGSTNYSVGSATINIFEESVSISEFDWTINKLSLNEQEMLAELNEHINAVVASLHDYMNNTLHIELK